MQRTLFALGLMLALAAPGFAQRGSGGNRGSGTQLRQRIHQPGAGEQTGIAAQKRDRKRDGTGTNCPSGPCVQQQQQTQTEAEVQTQQQTQTQSGAQAQAKNRTQSQSQVKTQNQTRTQTQQTTKKPQD